MRSRSLDVYTCAEVLGVTWDPDQYLRYVSERQRPFVDLLSRVDARDPRHVVDLGCGPGTATRTLLDRWPGAVVEGVDSSAEMVAAAQKHAEPGRLSFHLGDLRSWRPETPVDIVVSNATLQWVPGHLDMLPRLVGLLAPSGWLAVQVPGAFDGPAHVLLEELRSSPRWVSTVGLGLVPEPRVAEPADYLECLASVGATVDVWETTYLHVLPGPDAVLEWMRGAALRPVLGALREDHQDAFLREYGARLRAAFPVRPFGTVLPYRRIFAVARRRG